jgi:hippurate hydrolase
MAVLDLEREMIAWRHRLHSCPETGFQERQTADFVASALASLGLEVTAGVGGTGVVGTLRRGGASRAVGLRADMDALAIQEAGDLPYASRNPGRMHACGHDGHMAMLLGAARLLTEAAGLDGTVHFVFQPAEEHGRGAKAMIADYMFIGSGLPGEPGGTPLHSPHFDFNDNLLLPGARYFATIAQQLLGPERA